MSCATQLVSDVGIQTSTNVDVEEEERAVEESEIRIREYDAAKINLALKWKMPSREAERP